MAIAMCTAMPDQYGEEHRLDHGYGYGNTEEHRLSHPDDYQRYDRGEKQFHTSAVVSPNRDYHTGYNPSRDPERQYHTGAVVSPNRDYQTGYNPPRERQYHTGFLPYPEPERRDYQTGFIPHPEPERQYHTGAVVPPITGY